MPAPAPRVNIKFRVAEKNFRSYVHRERTEGLSMSTTTHSVPLLKRTQELVLNAPRRVSYEMMAAEAQCSSKWISLLAKGKLSNPGIVTVQRLHDYLANISTEA